MATGEQVSDFKGTPSDQARRWAKEISAAKESLKEWHAEAERAVKRYLDRRGAGDANTSDERRLNLYFANIQTKLSTLYGNTPTVDVTRRFADAKDDAGRVAGVLMDRHLNSDIERDGDTYAQALGYCLEDILIPCAGWARARYVAEFGPPVTTPPVLDEETGAVLAEGFTKEPKTYECVETDYVHWKDVLWSPAKVWHEVRWVAFRVLMSREKLEERFPGHGAHIPITHNTPDAKEAKADPWGRAEVWEIWDKDSKQRVFYVDGYKELLESQPDPLKLDNFFPCPRPVIPLATTTALIPRTEFELSRDLYNQIDSLQKRIDLLTDAVRVAGLYDAAAGEEVGKLLKQAGFVDIVPVKGFQVLKEGGGIRGAIDWFPIEPIAAAVVQLQAAQDRAIEQLYQVTGMADIMRGASDPAETARAQGIKARFGSVRLQKLQAESARFATDWPRIKAEIISKHFDVETIIKQSNAEYLPEADKQWVPQAAQLIKDKFSQYRIAVKSEALSLTDFAAQKNEAVEVIGAVSQYVSSSAPLAQAMPGSTPFLLEMLGVLVAKLKGGDQFEGIIDRAVEQAKAPQPQQQQEDPKAAAERAKLQGLQLKGQMDLAKEQFKAEAAAKQLGLEVQAQAVIESNQRQENVKEAAQKQMIANALRPAPVANGRPVK